MDVVLFAREQEDQLAQYILMHNLCELLTNEDTFLEDIEFQGTSKCKTCAC